MVGGKRVQRWRRRALPMVATLFRSHVVLLDDAGEPTSTVLATCDQLDRAIAQFEDWLVANPCPDLETARCMGHLVGACAGLWAMKTAVARRITAGVDTGAGQLPESFTAYMSDRVEALETAWSEVRRLRLLPA